MSVRAWVRSVVSVRAVLRSRWNASWRGRPEGWGAWGGLRFGSLGLKDTTIKNISLTGHLYSVQVGSITVLEMDGKELFRADGPVVVRNFQLGENRLSFTIKTKKESSPVWLLLQNIKFSQPSKLRGRVNNQKIENLRLTDVGIAFSINPGEHSVELRNGERLH